MLVRPGRSVPCFSISGNGNDPDGFAPSRRCQPPWVRRRRPAQRFQGPAQTLILDGQHVAELGPRKHGAAGELELTTMSGRRFRLGGRAWPCRLKPLQAGLLVELGDLAGHAAGQQFAAQGISSRELPPAWSTRVSRSSGVISVGLPALPGWVSILVVLDQCSRPPACRKHWETRDLRANLGWLRGGLPRACEPGEWGCRTGSRKIGTP